MTGEVLYRATVRHRCSPGVKMGDPIGPNEDGFPEGSRAAHIGTPWEYPRGTIWACGCGRVFRSLGAIYVDSPGRCDWTRVSRLRLRWMRWRSHELK